jgi:hypothetical protein
MVAQGAGKIEAPVVAKVVDEALVALNMRENVGSWAFYECAIITSHMR